MLDDVNLLRKTKCLFTVLSLAAMSLSTGTISTSYAEEVTINVEGTFEELDKVDVQEVGFLQSKSSILCV